VDAALAAEYWGQPVLYANVQHIVMISLGTGVGFSVVVNGKQHLGHYGLLEGGHMIINPSSDIRCGCGQYGTDQKRNLVCLSAVIIHTTDLIYL